ncbi:MAG: mucoidy inhibitor MuiA family protein [Erysipelotrichaceae bacterium]|nr:mucoidy inhibitor MuiA family protein [Erysipelotrichaceae bacterium]
MADLLTQVKTVNVFRNGAEVVRTGKTELKEGTQTLYVHGLTNSASADTARLYIEEGVSCANLRFEEADQENVHSRELQEKIALLQKQIEVKEMQLTLWQNNGDFTGHDNVSASEIQDYIEKLPERMEKLHKEIIALEKEIRDLQKEVEEELQKEGLPVLVADVTADRDGTFACELHYHETAAGWNPVYEIRSEKEEEIEIRMRGEIREDTNEDWNDVKVSLFTGDPSTNDVLPELLPLYLNIQENNVNLFKASGRAAAPMGMKMSMDLEDTMVAEEVAEAPMMRMETQEAEVQNDETMTEYALAGNRDILKGNKGTMADLQKYVIPAEYNIVTVPKADPHAYLVASIKTADLPILNAVEAGIYLKGRYTGSIYLDPDMTKEKVDITLGKEERIHVSYKELAKKNSTTLLKAQKVVEHQYETKITNLSDDDITILLKDQLPVSQNKDITVEALDLGGAKLEKDYGTLEKKVDVKAKETETYHLSYKVMWPKDKRIQQTRAHKRAYCPVCGAPVTGRFCPECGSDTSV